MSDNISFILQSVGQVSFDHRPIPESAVIYLVVLRRHLSIYSLTVGDDEVLIEVKKTGRPRLLFSFQQIVDARPTRYLWIRCTVIYSFVAYRLLTGYHHAQVHYLVHGRIGDFAVESPMVHLMMSP
jgi:hypothetical protein